MANDFTYITYYQAMAFFRAIEQIRETNPYFNDEISHLFETNILSETAKMATSPMPLRVYKVSRSMITYLSRLTSVNIYDKEYMKKFKMEQKQREEELINKVVNEGFESLKKK